MGDRPRAAYHLAQVAELVNRAPGLMPESASIGVAQLLAEAAALAGDDPAAQARVVIADGFNGSRLDPVSAELAERGITLARRAGDPLAESAALDLQTSIQLVRGDIPAAAASALRRTELLAPLRGRPIACGLELFDACQMAAETAVAAGDLTAAREFAEKRPRSALLSRGRPPGHRAASGGDRAGRRLGRDGRLRPAVPGGLGAGRAATGRQPQPGSIRGRGGVRAAR